MNTLYCKYKNHHCTSLSLCKMNIFNKFWIFFSVILCLHKFKTTFFYEKIQINKSLSLAEIFVTWMTVRDGWSCITQALCYDWHHAHYTWMCNCVAQSSSGMLLVSASWDSWRLTDAAVTARNSCQNESGDVFSGVEMTLRLTPT